MTGKNFCKMTWRLKKYELIRSIPSIRADLVVLAIDLALATVGAPTTLSKTNRMPAIHKFLKNVDFAIPGLISAVRRLVAVVLNHFAGCRKSPFLVSGHSKKIGLQV